MGSGTDADDRIDLEAYFERIGFSGPCGCSIETLRMLHALHPAAIAFENLDAWLGSTVALDAISLERKLVDQGRGGWCFEHNLLFSRVLASIGFEVDELAARVLWNAPPGAERPRTHMLLLVTVDAVRYVADVGFGGLTLTAPLRLEADVEQSTPHEVFRVTARGGQYVIEARIEGDFKPLYEFDLQPQRLADFEMTNWYLSNHPESRFRHHLIAARATADARYALLDEQLTIHRPGRPSERTSLPDADALLDVLTGELNIRPPDLDALHLALESLFDR